LVESLPFCAEKRSALLSEIEDPLLLCSKSIRSSSRKHGDYRGVTQQFCVATQLVTPLGNKKKHTMDIDNKNASDLDPDNIIPVTLDNLSEEDRRELERELEDEMAEARKLKLSGYFKTRSGAVKKVTAPKPPVHGTKVINSDEELAHLIDVSVASKYGSDMVDATRTITQLASKFDEFKEQFSKEIENSLPRQIRSLMYDENSGKAPIPPENSSFINLHSNTHTPGASASAMQPQIAVNSMVKIMLVVRRIILFLVLLRLVFQLRFHKITTAVTEVFVLILIYRNLVIRL
jgi:hypothetical protein